MSFDEYIFVTPSFLRGAASSIDIGASLGQEAFVLFSSATEADRQALQSDWRSVGRELNAAFHALSSETNQNVTEEK